MNGLSEGHLAWHEEVLINLLQTLPAGLPGKARLARLVCSHFLNRRDVVIESRYGEKLLVPILREPISFYTLLNGHYESELFDLTSQILDDGDTFVDIGANVGIFSLFASNVLGEAGTVIAIEASPSIIPYLRRNISLNAASNVQLFPVAVGETGPTKRPFWEAPTDQFGMGSLAAQFHDDPVEVCIDTLDNILLAAGSKRIRLIKVDIEGFEAAAFAGASILDCKSSRPPVIFEFAAWAETRAGYSAGSAQAYLLSRDYELHIISNSGALEKLRSPLTEGSANILALPVGYNAARIRAIQ